MRRLAGSVEAEAVEEIQVIVYSEVEEVWRKAVVLVGAKSVGEGDMVVVYEE